MPNKKESYLGVKAYKGLKSSDIRKLSESELRAYIRTGEKLLRSNVRSREKAGLPGFFIPHAEKGVDYSKRELRDILFEQRRKIADPKRTATGFRELSGKTLSSMYERIKGVKPRITFAKKGLWLNATYIPYEEINRFFEEFHKAQERVGWNRGTTGSAELLSDFIDIYESGSFEEFVKKSKERIEQILEEESKKVIEEAESIDEDILPW